MSLLTLTGSPTTEPGLRFDAFLLIPWKNATIKSEEMLILTITLLLFLKIFDREVDFYSVHGANITNKMRHPI